MYIECGLGWYDLIDKLSQDLENEILKLPTKEQKEYYAVQVKEKCGTLRYYMSTYTDKISDLIEQAETASATICERCGATGSLIRSNHGWLQTLCEPCSETLLKGSNQ